MSKKLSGVKISTLYRRAMTGKLKGALQVKSYSKEELEDFLVQIKNTPPQAQVSYDESGNPIKDKSEQAKEYQERIVAYIQDLIDNYDAYMAAESSSTVYVGQKGSKLVAEGAEVMDETFEDGVKDGQAEYEEREVAAEELLALLDQAHEAGRRRRGANYEASRDRKSNDVKIDELVRRIARLERQLEQQKTQFSKKMGKQGTLEMLTTILQSDNKTLENTLREGAISISDGIIQASQRYKKLQQLIHIGIYEDLSFDGISEDLEVIRKTLVDMKNRYESETIESIHMDYEDLKETAERAQQAWLQLQAGEITQEEFDKNFETRFVMFTNRDEKEDFKPVSFKEVYDVLAALDETSDKLTEQLIDALNATSARGEVSKERALHLFNLENEVTELARVRRISGIIYRPAYDELIDGDTLQRYIAGDESVTSEDVTAMYGQLKDKILEVSKASQEKREKLVSEHEERIRVFARERGYSDEQISLLFSERARDLGFNFGGYESRREQFVTGLTGDGKDAVDLVELREDLDGYWTRAAEVIADRGPKGRMGAEEKKHVLRDVLYGIGMFALGALVSGGTVYGIMSAQYDSYGVNADIPAIYAALEDGKLSSEELQMLEDILNSSKSTEEEKNAAALVKKLAGKLGDLEGIQSLVDRMFEIQKLLASGENIDRSSLENEFEVYLQILSSYRDNAEDIIKQYIDNSMSIVDGITTLNNIKPITDMLADGTLDENDRIALNNFAASTNENATQRNIAGAIVNALKAAESNDISTLKKQFAELLNTYIDMLESANTGNLTPEQEQSLQGFESLLSDLSTRSAYLQGMLKGVQDANANAKYKAEVQNIIDTVADGITEEEVGGLRELATNGSDAQKSLAGAIVELYDANKTLSSDKDAMRDNIVSVLNHLVSAGNAVEGGSFDSAALETQLKAVVAAVVGDNSQDALVEQIVADYANYSAVKAEIDELVGLAQGGITEDDIDQLTQLTHKGTANQQTIAQAMLDLYNSKNSGTEELQQKVKDMLTALVTATNGVENGTFDGEALSSSLKQLVAGVVGNNSQDAFIDQIVAGYTEYNSLMAELDAFVSLAQDGINSDDLAGLTQLAQSGTERQQAVANAMLDLYNAQTAAESGKLSAEQKVEAVQQSVKDMLTALVNSGDGVEAGTFNSEDLATELKDLVAGIVGDNSQDTFIEQIVADYIQYNTLQTEIDAVVSLVKDGVTPESITALKQLASEGTENQQALANALINLYEAKTSAESGKQAAEQKNATMQQNIKDMLTALVGAGTSVESGNFNGDALATQLKQLVSAAIGDSSQDTYIDQIVASYTKYSETKQKADDVYNLFAQLLEDGKIDKEDISLLQSIVAGEHDETLESFATALLTALNNNATQQDKFDALMNYFEKYVELEQDLVENMGSGDISTQLQELQAIEDTLGDIVDPSVFEAAEQYIQDIQEKLTELAGKVSDLQGKLDDLQSKYDQALTEDQINDLIFAELDRTTEDLIASYVGDLGSNYKVKIDGKEYTYDQVKDNDTLRRAFNVAVLRSLTVGGGATPSISLGGNIYEGGGLGG